MNKMRDASLQLQALHVIQSLFSQQDGELSNFDDVPGVHTAAGEEHHPKCFAASAVDEDEGADLGVTVIAMATSGCLRVGIVVPQSCVFLHDSVDSSQIACGALRES